MESPTWETTTQQLPDVSGGRECNPATLETVYELCMYVVHVRLPEP